MLYNFKGIFLYFIFASIFIALMSFIFFFYTLKYKKNRVNFFALFTTLNKRKIIIVASLILNLTLVCFFSVAIAYYNDFVTYMILINSLILMIVSVNFHIIFSNILYTSISVFALKIINLVYNYLYSVYYDRLTFLLGAVFVLLIIVYELFVTFRQLEIVVKKNGGVLNDRRTKKSRKSRKSSNK